MTQSLPRAIQLVPKHDSKVFIMILLLDFSYGSCHNTYISKRLAGIQALKHKETFMCCVWRTQVIHNNVNILLYFNCKLCWICAGLPVDIPSGLMKFSKRWWTLGEAVWTIEVLGEVAINCGLRSMKLLSEFNCSENIDSCSWENVLQT